MDTLPSKTFCILPWIHLSTRPNGNMRVCCTANASSAQAFNNPERTKSICHVKNDDGREANLAEVSLAKAWNGLYMRQVRLDMLAGQIPPCCQKCFEEERTGHRSKRLWETEYWSNQISIQSLLEKTSIDGTLPPEIRYIDLRLGRSCNLKCMMCSPHDSNIWHSDWIKMWPRVKNSALKQTMCWEDAAAGDEKYLWYVGNDSFWQELYEQIPNIKQLYLAGGESTIIPEHYDLLAKIIESKYAHNIELRYNSNGIELPEQLFQMWSAFKNVKFHFSLDSIESMNYYIRYPSKFSHIEKQLERLDNTPANIEVTLACAVQILNIYYLPDFIKWKLNKNFKKINAWPLGAGLSYFHLVYIPPHLNIRVLPQDFKHAIEKKYEEFFIWLSDNWSLTGAPSRQDFLENINGIKRLKGLLSFMTAQDWSVRMEEFREYIHLLDETRNLDFKKIFPEMADLV